MKRENLYLGVVIFLGIILLAVGYVNALGSPTTLLCDGENCTNNETFSENIEVGCYDLGGSKGNETIYSIDGYYNFSGLRTLGVSTFDNSLEKEDLIFSGNESNLRYLEIPRYAHVTSAVMNLSAAVSTEGVYTGEYFSTRGIIWKPGGITQDGTYFWITDTTNDRVYKYYMNGVYAGEYFNTAEVGNEEPMGITQNGTYLWVTGYNNYKVYKYYMNGTYTGDYFDTEKDLGHPGHARPSRITQNGTYFWIIGDGNSKIYKYYMNGTYTGDYFYTKAKNGITQDGNYFWMTDYKDRVHKYHINGTYVGDMFGTIASMSGAMVQNGKYFWIVHSNYHKIYKYYMDSELTNPHVQINNVQIWNYSGEFDSIEQTLDFYSVLNTALNNGDCDCEDCILNGDSCKIPFVFHSDNLGALEYSNIDIDYQLDIEIYSWKTLGNHTEASIFIWDISDVNSQSGVELRCRAIGLDGNNSYSDYYSPDMNITILNTPCFDFNIALNKNGGIMYSRKVNGSFERWNPSRKRVWEGSRNQRTIPEPLLSWYGPIHSDNVSHIDAGWNFNNGEYDLLKDIQFCQGMGIVLRANVTLDGQGHTLLGNKTGIGVYVLNDRADNTMTKNIVIDNFKIGYGVRKGDNNILEDSVIKNSGRAATRINGRNGAMDNIVRQNLFEGNKRGMVGKSSGTLIYYNNFVNNVRGDIKFDVVGRGGLADDGVCGGNYYSGENYSGDRFPLGEMWEAGFECD